MKKRFIVLIDFSEHSQWLLKFSYDWAQQSGATLALVHHDSDPTPGLGDTEMLTKIKIEGERRALAKLKEFTSSVLGNHGEIEHYTDSYNVASAVMKMETPEVVDYVFVGMNDKNGIERLFSASTALQLRDQLEHIIIAMPTSVTDFQFNTLRVAVKPSFPLNEARFQELLSVMEGRINSINFFSVVKPGSHDESVAAYLKSLCERYGNMVPAMGSVVEGADVANVVEAYMLANGGLLAVQKGPRNLMDIFRAYFTTELINNAHIPVVILP